MQETPKRHNFGNNHQLSLEFIFILDVDVIDFSDLSIFNLLVEAGDCGVNFALLDSVQIYI